MQINILKNKQTKKNIYEAMLEDLAQNQGRSELLEQAMDVNNLQSKKSIPLRYRIIALGFMKHLCVEDLNDELINQGCQPLYARSSFEATLIYAFRYNIDYKNWVKIYNVCEKARINYANSKDIDVHTYFQDGKITFGELERYVLDYSQNNNGELYTKNLTRELNHQIMELGKSYEEFLLFYVSNLEQFSEVREKARYYFCKYLYYHLLEKIEAYNESVVNRAPTQEELLGLLPIKAESTLRRRITPKHDLMDALRECSLSPAEIFEEFNYYFFGYVSSDWIQIMLEDIVNVEDLSELQILKIADYIRENASKKEFDKLNGLSAKEIVDYEKNRLEEMEEKETTRRKGEKAIRNYLRGNIDLDRTTLICFLLFFGSSINSRDDVSISQERINEIMDECGFSMLRKKNPFDAFVLSYLKQEDPVSLLMKEMDRYIEEGKSIFFFELYKNSKSNAKEIRKIMLKT